MNILIYNFINEIDDSLSLLTQSHINNIFFAVSISDLRRIINKNTIDILIMKMDYDLDSLIEYVFSNNPQTELYIITNQPIKKDNKKVTLYPINYPFETIIKRIGLNGGINEKNNI